MRLSTYAVDNGDLVMPTSNNNFNPSSYVSWTSPAVTSISPIHGYIFPYLSINQQTDYAASVWLCPLLNGGNNPLYYPGPTRPPGTFPIGYGLNSDSENGGVKFASITNPAESAAFGDTGEANSMTLSYVIPNASLLYTSAEPWPYFLAPHNKRGNVSWYDGHVSSESPVIPTDSPYTPEMNKWNNGFLAPITGPITTAALAANPMRNYYYFFNKQEQRLFVNPGAATP